jgi:hypothetical protein
MRAPASIARLCLSLAAAGLLAAAVPAGAAAPGFVTGPYSGTTQQRLPITARITNTGMASAEYKADYRCVRGRRRIRPRHPQLTQLSSAPYVSPGKIAERYTFRLEPGNRRDTVVFTATVTGNRLRGSFSETYVSRSRLDCRSGTVTFSLTR